MERLTTNKDTSEMNMVELAHNSCYTKEHEVRYRDFDMDIDSRELAIKLLDEFVNITNEFTCDEDFDSYIVDAMQYGIHNILGLIAIFYRNLWAMADLRERLKEYEDLGITPDQIKEIDKLYTEKCIQVSNMKKYFKESSGWIPCNERMPEESLNSVLGWDEYRQRCCFVQYYGGRWILGNGIESVKITAWQPVPEPYKS